MEQTKTSETKTISFWTTGEEMTNTLRMFIEEGSYKTAFTILEDGGLPLSIIREFFLYNIKLEGDTRTEEGIQTVDDNDEYDLKEIFSTGTATALYADKFKHYELKRSVIRESNISYNGKREQYKYSKNMVYLYKVLTLDEVRDLVFERCLKREKFGIKKDDHGRYEGDGAILKNGVYITCGYQEHNELWPILCALGFTKSNDWTKDEELIHVSSGQMSGSVAYSIADNYKETELVTSKQIDALWKFRNHIKGEYGGPSKGATGKVILDYISRTESHGGKYNNLQFIKRFYPNLNVPKISKDQFENSCIRTSPKLSLPGLLNSKFNITDYDLARAEINADWEQFKDVRGQVGNEHYENKLHIFYQEHLEGSNGVCHYFEKGHFTYSCSDVQGDIVIGKPSTRKLFGSLYDELRSAAREFYNDLGKPVQLEFVISEGKLYIVQLRLLKNNYKKGQSYSPNPDLKKFGLGNTFSSGNIDVHVDDILIVEEDAESKDLLGKKALIVKANVEFSHILALSKALRIPSMYGTGEIKELESYNGEVQFHAKNETAWILKLEK